MINSKEKKTEATVNSYYCAGHRARHLPRFTLHCATRDANFSPFFIFFSSRFDAKIETLSENVCSETKGGEVVVDGTLWSTLIFVLCGKLNCGLDSPESPYTLNTAGTFGRSSLKKRDTPIVGL